MTEIKQPDTAAAVRVLAKDVDVLRGAVADVTELAETVKAAATEAKDGSESAQRAVLTLTESVKKLRNHVVDIEDAVLRTPDEEPPEPRFHWLTVSAVDAERASDELRDLAGWVQGVYLRYAEASLAPCWMWHETVIADLHVLYMGFLDATDGKTGTAFKLMDWHDRYRPSAVARIKAELQICDKAGAIAYENHIGDGKLVNNPPIVPGWELGAELSHWWATTHATEPAPTPTDEMVQEAREAQDTRRHLRHK